jgi:hypothetical protein
MIYGREVCSAKTSRQGVIAPTRTLGLRRDRREKKIRNRKSEAPNNIEIQMTQTPASQF